MDSNERLSNMKASLHERGIILSSHNKVESNPIPDLGIKYKDITLSCRLLIKSNFHSWIIKLCYNYTEDEGPTETGGGEQQCSSKV